MKFELLLLGQNKTKQSQVLIALQSQVSEHSLTSNHGTVYREAAASAEAPHTPQSHN